MTENDINKLIKHNIEEMNRIGASTDEALALAAGLTANIIGGVIIRQGYPAAQEAAVNFKDKMLDYIRQIKGKISSMN